MSILESLIEDVLTYIVMGLLAIFTLILGQQKKVRLLLIVGTLILPVIGLAMITTRLTARIVVSNNPLIAIDSYAAWIAAMVGFVVFGYTVLWFWRIKTWVDVNAKKVADKLEEDEKMKIKKAGEA
jgi:hypothetical protein